YRGRQRARPDQRLARLVTQALEDTRSSGRGGRAHDRDPARASRPPRLSWPAVAAGTVTQPGWIRRTTRFLRPHRRLIVVAVVAALISMGATAVMPLLLRQILDTVVVAHTGRLLPSLVGLLVFGVARMVFAGLRRYAATAVALKVEYDMRNEIFDHLQRLD